MSDIIKVKDLAVELKMSAKELQRLLGEMHIEVQGTTSPLNADDVVKVKNHVQSITKDVERREINPGVIIRRRRNPDASASEVTETAESAVDETADDKKVVEKKATSKKAVETQDEDVQAKDAKSAPKKTKKDDSASKEVKTKSNIEKTEKNTTQKTADEEKPRPTKTKKKKEIDSPAKIISPARIIQEVKPQVVVAVADTKNVLPAEAPNLIESKSDVVGLNEQKTADNKTADNKNSEDKDTDKSAPAPAASAIPDTDSARSILPPIGQKTRVDHGIMDTEDLGTRVRVISRPGPNEARILERGKPSDAQPRGAARPDGRRDFRKDGARPSEPNRAGAPDNRGAADNRAPAKDGFRPRPARPGIPRVEIGAVAPPSDSNDQSRKKRQKGRRTVEFGNTESQDVARRRNATPGMGGDDDQYRHRRHRKQKKQIQSAVQSTQPMKAAKRKIRFEEAIRVADLAHQMGIKSSEVIKILFNLGVMATINNALDFDTTILVASEFGYEVEKVGFAEENYLVPVEADSLESKKHRPPVVTIMGHVDHGKTSLLDAIRKTSVTSVEAGGITQHIGAYHVKTKRGDIVFLDTPGHEAFTSMRARGAQITDLVVLVVAADDGVMEQTREAINHSKAAGVPILVAVNKIDKEAANPERVLRELADLGLQAEDWGGDTVFGYVSAKTGEGLDALLELIALQAEIMELTANPDKPARGRVVEAKLDKGRGPVASVLIQEGTVKQGDIFVCGIFAGRVRALFNDQGRKVKEAGPSIPVEVQGFDGVPDAGEEFICLSDEKAARRIAETRAVKQRERELTKQSRVTLETFLASTPLDKEAQVLNLVIKADVQGSLEAITEALHKLSTEKVRITVIHSGVGAISETDIMLAAASSAIVIGFNVRPTAKVKSVAEHEMVDIRFYDVIYKLVEEIRSAMAGLLAPISREVYLGQAEVREPFSVPKVGAIAGSIVNDGKIVRNSGIRLLREGVVVYTGKVNSLRRHKDDVKEVAKGFECGIGLENFNDIKIGDVLECFETVEEAATL